MIEQQLRMTGIERELGTAFNTDFLTIIKQVIFAPYSIYLRKLRDTLLVENKQFTGNTDIWVRYKTQQYPPPIDEIVPLYKGIVELDSSLYTRMDDYLEKRKEFKAKFSVINAYLRQGLSMCNTVIDLFHMVPEILHKYFNPLVVERRKDSWPSVPKRVAVAFHVQHKKEADLIAELLLTNILLGS